MNVRQWMRLDFSEPLLILLVITLLSFESIDLFYKLAGLFLIRSPGASVYQTSSAAVENSRPPALQDYAVISERNLFRSTLKEVKEDSERENGEQNVADFDLRGTMACDSSFGYIVVEEKDTRKQKLYRLGEKIGSRKLVKITRNSAVLRGEDGDIKLKIKETVEDAFLSASAGGKGPSPPLKGQGFAPKALSVNAGPLESIMNQAVVRPFMNRGVREGYIISNIAPNSLYEKAGLQNGDIILEINHNKMQNANDMMQLLQTMQAGNRLELRIRRQGRLETLNYTLD